MHAVVIRSRSTTESRNGPFAQQVVPGVSQAPGFVAGYWTRKDNTGLAMVFFESEEAANGVPREGAVDAH